MKAATNITIILFAFALCSFNAFAMQDSAVQREELAPFVWPGYEILSYAYGDVNADNLEDAVLVLKKLDERKADMFLPKDLEHPEKRPLLILVRRKNDSIFVEAARNENAVYCADCGGIFGDPFDGVEIKNGAFSIYHYGGSAWRWRYDVTFQFDMAKGNWFVTKVVNVSYHTSNPERIKKTVKTQQQLGQITFEEFNIYKE